MIVVVFGIVLLIVTTFFNHLWIVQLYNAINGLPSFEKLDKKLDRLLCKLFEHNFRFDSADIPNKRICKRCKVRERFDMPTLKWIEDWSDAFTEGMSDKEMIKKWHKLNMVTIYLLILMLTT